MSLKETFLKLKHRTSTITTNPLLDCFEQSDLETLDREALSDPFIAAKSKNILKEVEGLGIDYSENMKSAFDEYAEGLVYLLLREKFGTVARVPESTSKTPDFKVEVSVDGDDEGSTVPVHAEMKSMAYAFGNFNYKQVMEDGLAAQIDIERQRAAGTRVAFGITEIRPLYNPNRDYDPDSSKYPIQLLIEKIEQNLKEGQFAFGETVLIINLKQLLFGSSYLQDSVPVYHEKQSKSLVSGILWNIAFGRAGHLMYKPIEFEGKENIEGELERNGILVDYPWVRALVFVTYSLRDSIPKIVGLRLQSGKTDPVEQFLHQFCDIVNDDKNSGGYQVYDRNGG